MGVDTYSDLVYGYFLVGESYDHFVAELRQKSKTAEDYDEEYPPELSDLLDELGYGLTGSDDSYWHIDMDLKFVVIGARFNGESLVGHERDSEVCRIDLDQRPEIHPSIHEMVEAYDLTPNFYNVKIRSV